MRQENRTTYATKGLILIGVFIFATNIYAQSSRAKKNKPVSTLEEVSLPLLETKSIGVDSKFEESKISPQELKKIFVVETQKVIDTGHFFLIDSTGSRIEYFVLTPCKKFNVDKSKPNQVIEAGLITSSLFIDLMDKSYRLTLDNFLWVDKKKNKYQMETLYLLYLNSEDKKEKRRLYGILKSCEYSIVETFENMTIVIQEIINQKIDKILKNKK